MSTPTGPSDTPPRDRRPGEQETTPDDARVEDNRPGDTAVRDTHPDDTAVRDTHPDDTAVRDTHPDDTAVRDTHPDDTAVRDTHPDDTAVRDTHPDDTAVRDTHPRDTHPDGTDGTDGTDEEFSRDRKSVLTREKEEFGGIKFGSAFFGWLAATGTAVLLTALVAGAGTAVSVATNTDPEQVADAQSPETIGLAGGIALLAIMFIAYYCGGYVAGRMARFNGLRQGVAVWLWAVLIAVVVAILGLVAGQEYDVLGRLNSFPRIPVNEGDLTGGGLVAVLVLAAVTLVGAILGGLAGMRFHRRVDKAGLGA